MNIFDMNIRLCWII